MYHLWFLTVIPLDKPSQYETFKSKWLGVMWCQKCQKQHVSLNDSYGHKICCKQIAEQGWRQFFWNKNCARLRTEPNKIKTGAAMGLTVCLNKYTCEYTVYVHMASSARVYCIWEYLIGDCNYQFSKVMKHTFEGIN